MPEDSIPSYSGLVANKVAEKAISDNFHNAPHNLMPNSEDPLEPYINYPDWILPLLVLVFMVLVWVRIYHNKRAKLLVKAFISRLYIVHMLRESDSLMVGLSIALNFVFVVVLSLFLFLVIIYYQVNIPFSDVINPIFIFSGALVLLYAGKTFVLWFLGVIFNEGEKFYEYIFHVFLFNKILGIFLLPVVIGISYSKIGAQYLIYTGIFLIIIIYLYRIYRGVIVCTREANLSKYYIFLYLCTLEILPMALIARFVSSAV
ncbi:MAG TPA: DUF4271 domain-containing protein [Flavobacteriales bacterium]|nr:DUF4271 domain-containing protein [Flavobacteriales bacterium]HIN40251.1 DUF4271 domain-containing protein [Flavobacteriales bacterium]